MSHPTAADYDIIDAHVHLYRDVATEKLALPLAGRRDRDRWGNAESIVPYMDRHGISHVVALNLFPTSLLRRRFVAKLPDRLAGQHLEDAREAIERDLADRLRAQNQWLCEVARDEPRVVAGIGIQKLLSPRAMAEEVRRRAAQGARAVKLIPGWYREFPDDSAYWPAYEACQELGLAVTVDTGSLGLGRHMAHPEQDNKVIFGEPIRLRKVLEAFPRLTVVMCHFGSAFWDQRVHLALRFDNLYFDISGGFHRHGFRARDGDRALPEADAVRVMRTAGIDRMMFGSDGPSVMVRPSLRQFLRLDLTNRERRMVLSETARRVYRID